MDALIRALRLMPVCFCLVQLLMQKMDACTRRLQLQASSQHAMHVSAILDARRARACKWFAHKHCGRGSTCATFNNLTTDHPHQHTHRLLGGILMRRDTHTHANNKGGTPPKTHEHSGSSMANDRACGHKLNAPSVDITRHTQTHLGMYNRGECEQAGRRERVGRRVSVVRSESGRHEEEGRCG